MTQRYTRTERAPRDQPFDATRPRIEPSLDDPGFPPASDTAYEKLHGLGPEFGEYLPPGRSRMRRITMMFGVFIVGATVGLAGAWWMHRSAPGALAGASSAAASRTATTTQGVTSKRSVAVRGISPSELPYDGAPPPAEMPPVKAEAVPSAPADTLHMTSGTSNGNRRDGNTGASAAGAAEQDASMEMPTPPAFNSKSAHESGAGDIEDAPKSARSSKPSGASVASAAPKRRSASKSAADREIERIRRQADEELKKKTEHGRALGGSRNGEPLTKGRDGTSKVAAASPASRAASTRAMLARCDRSSNFIRSELCRWQVCNGSWGKYGCPSYKPHTPNY